MMTEYITVEGELRIYKYDSPSSRNNRRPKCPNCSSKMQGIFKSNNHKLNKIGWFCPSCEQMYFYKRYKIFKIKEKR